MGKAGVAMPYKVLLRDESEAVNLVFVLLHLKILKRWAAGKEAFVTT